MRLLSDDGLERLIDDLSRVPLVPEERIEGLQDGLWLTGERCCWDCGVAVDERTRGCLRCINRHEKRRQRNALRAAA